LFRSSLAATGLPPRLISRDRADRDQPSQRTGLAICAVLRRSRTSPQAAVRWHSRIAFVAMHFGTGFGKIVVEYSRTTGSAGNCH